MLGTPQAEVEIDAALVHALLKQQHPDLASLPCVPIDSGWDNVLVRLGDGLCLRFPRRAVAAALIEHEQRWLPPLAKALPLPIPVPLRTGVPGCGYPWRWSVVPWIDGTASDLCWPHASEATQLGEFLRALHVPAPAEAPSNPVRGVPLKWRAPTIEGRMRRLETRSPLINAQLWRIWRAALAAPVDVDPTWIHGDLHARNILVKDGSLAAVIDWGDVAAGDRATDLAAIWMLFSDRSARQLALRACGSVTDTTCLRAKGWAIGFGVTLLETGLADNPRHAAMGERTLQHIADADP
jgi:aminoglycoside phosphotransferase (APT) family kinase protein